MNIETARKLLELSGIRVDKDDSLLSLVLLNDVVLKGVVNPLFPAGVNEMQTILRGKGVRISNDDPIFTLLILNGIVMRAAIDQVRTVQIRRRLKTMAGVTLKILLAAVLGLCVGVFMGMHHLEPSRIFAASVGLVLGIALGALGMSHLAE